MIMARAFADTGAVAGRMRDPLGTDWTKDRWAFGKAMAALNQVVEAYHKPDEGEEPVTPPAAAVEWQKTHETDFPDIVADMINRAVYGISREGEAYFDLGAAVRPLIGIDDVLGQVIREQEEAVLAGEKKK